MFPFARIESIRPSRRTDATPATHSNACRDVLLEDDMQSLALDLEVVEGTRHNRPSPCR